MTLGSAFPSILAAAQAGAGWAFTRIWDDLSPVVHGYLRTQGSPEPEDLTNEVFLGVFRSVARFEGDEAQFRSWVFTIAHRRLTDERRRRGRRPVEPAATVGDGPGGDVEQDALVALGGASVRELLDALVPDQRDVLLLRILSDMTVEQVAAALDKSVGAVKQLQRRGLAAVRRELARTGVPL